MEAFSTLIKENNSLLMEMSKNFISEQSTLYNQSAKECSDLIQNLQEQLKLMESQQVNYEIKK